LFVPRVFSADKQQFTHALYNLAAHPEYIAPLREEIEFLVTSEGWEKSTLAKMRKLDSFLKESLRLHPLAARTGFFILELTFSWLGAEDSETIHVL
jgi:hypothetical protein